MTAENPPLLGVVDQLIDLLSQDVIKAEDVAAYVGPVVNDPGPPLPTDLRPILDGVRSAELAFYPDTGQPYALTLEIEPDARLTPAVLRENLGDYQPARSHRGMPREILFYPRARGGLWRVAVIAQLEAGTEDLDDGRVASLGFRRDAASD